MSKLSFQGQSLDNIEGISDAEAKAAVTLLDAVEADEMTGTYSKGILNLAANNQHVATLVLQNINQNLQVCFLI